jgi:diguanylate cyclase (GGDEF)-like protein
MLSKIISGLPDAFFVFDPNGGCVWANNEGCRLAGVTDKKYEQITPNLHSMFGEVSKTDSNVIRCEVTTDGVTRFYDLEESQVKGSDGKLNGFYLRIQDVTDEETEIRVRDEQIGKISRDAYKDVLTGVGTKAAYTRKTAELNELISGGKTELAVVMVDLNDLKGINDKHGHKAGDEYIRGCSRLVCHAFKHSPVFRIGGDEFVVILTDEDFNDRSEIIEKLRADFKEAYENEENEPWLRFSAAVGIADAEPDDESYEQVFRRADKRMYEEKHRFKEMHGSYR